MNNKQKQYVAVVVGTRPGIIKMAPIVRALERENVAHFIIHTGQHYSSEMDDVFMEELGLKAKVHRVRGSNDKITHGAKTGHMLQGVEEILLGKRPAAVLVCGDANTNLAAGIAARKLHMILGHVESGLRSFDWSMPEEHNRVMLDHISDLLFAPTQATAENLERESVRGEIHVTGNTIVDSVIQHLKIAERTSNVLNNLKIEPNRYILLTSHREENVDNPARLLGIIESVERVLMKHGLPVVFPVHPRTRKMMVRFGYETHLEDMFEKGLKIFKPFGYIDFLMIIKYARLIMTDSGGLQEEACILQVPTVTLRENSERPETIIIGTNILAGTRPDRIDNAVKTMLSKNINISEKNCPFGDGRAAERIVCTTLRAIEKGVRLSNKPKYNKEI